LALFFWLGNQQFLLHNLRDLRIMMIRLYCFFGKTY
jgi:hypothetical protein